MQLAKPQKYLGSRSLFACLIVINILAILAIDMYVPALPSMQKSFDVSAAYLNLTLFGFFVMCAASMVIAGPLSDLYGRKPVLLAGCIAFTLSSAGCMVAQSVEALVVFRVGEALGYGFIATVETAIIKDSYEGDDLQLAMTCLQSLIIVGPAFAPFLGTLMLSLGGWRVIFAFLTVCGLVSIALTLPISESHSSIRVAGNARAALSDTMQGTRALVKDKKFMSLAILMGVAGIPYFAFIAVVSYVLMDYFAVGYLEYSVIYAAACIVTIIAPYIYIALSKHMGVNAILKLCITLTFISAVSMGFGGHVSPLLFLITFIPYAIAEGVVRPMAFVVLLDQPEDRVGAASSFSNFAYSILTSVGTVLATISWPTFILGIIVLTAGSAIIMTALYLWGAKENATVAP